MKVKEAIQELQKCDPEANLLVYIGEVEEYGNVEEVKTYEIEDQNKMRYSKGDVPELTQRTVILEGWLTVQS